VKSFGPQPVLLRPVARVPTGSITVIIGRSGGGKSVLLRHLIGLLYPDAGRVLVDGVDITTLRGRALDEVRRRYGVVFQGGALFDSLSCHANVAFPLREKLRLPATEIAKRVDAALGQVGLEGMAPSSRLKISAGMPQARRHRAGAGDRARESCSSTSRPLDSIVLVNTIHHLILDLHRRFRFHGGGGESRDSRRYSRSPTRWPCCTTA